ncbi:MAG: glycosyl hydrolase-related protein, partial [Bryobacteraceae bacterium]
HVLSYAFIAHEGAWRGARIPQMAWEYNRAPVILTGHGEKPPRSFIETSDNVIVEAMRREGSQIELRFVECLGYPGTAEVRMPLPHSKAALTDLLGQRPKPLRKAARYRFPIRPQQIVTMRFDTSSSAPQPALVQQWDEFVPAAKLAALHAYSSDKGHPPRGD